MANGGGGGGSYMSIRQLPEDRDIEILQATVSVVLDREGFGHYKFDYHVRGTERCKPHAYYYHIVPNPPGEIKDLVARDESGTLETLTESFRAGDRLKSEVKIRYRTEMLAGAEVHLTFEFKVKASILKADAGLRPLLVYTDYLSYSVACRNLEYRLLPPRGFAYYETSNSDLTPVVDRGGFNPHPRPIRLAFPEVPPRTPVPVTVPMRAEHRFSPRAVGRAVAAAAPVYASALLGVIFTLNAWTILLVTVLLGVLMLAFVALRRRN